MKNNLPKAKQTPKQLTPKNPTCFADCYKDLQKIYTKSLENDFKTMGDDPGVLAFLYALTPYVEKDFWSELMSSEINLNAALAFYFNRVITFEYELGKTKSVSSDIFQSFVSRFIKLQFESYQTIGILEAAQVLGANATDLGDSQTRQPMDIVTERQWRWPDEVAETEPVPVNVADLENQLYVTKGLLTRTLQKLIDLDYLQLIFDEKSILAKWGFKNGSSYDIGDSILAAVTAPTLAAFTDRNRIELSVPVSDVGTGYGSVTLTFPFDTVSKAMSVLFNSTVTANLKA